MVSCLMGDSTALASAIVRCCPRNHFTDSTNKIGGYSLEYPPVLVIIVRLSEFLTLRPVSVPFRHVPAGKLPLIFCPLVLGQRPF